LDRQEIERRARALEDLLRHHLSAHLGTESFAWHGEPEHSVQSAWRALVGGFAPEGVQTVDLPEPGESALSVARRLVSALESLGPRPGAGLWRARLEHASRGPRAGAAAFEGLLGRSAASRVPTLGVDLALLAGWCECLLDRGGVGEAFGLLGDRPEWIASDPRLGWLWTWTLLARGELAAADAARAGLDPWRGPLPTALVALRLAFPEASAVLPGRTPPDERAPLGHAPISRDRRALGASVLALFRFEGHRGARAVWLDVAPGLRADLEEWLVDRRDAHQDPGQPAHSLVIEAAPKVAHGAPGRPPAGALGERALALSLVPVLDRSGEVAGWLHVECEHHLLPCPRRLERTAQVWREELAAPETISGEGVFEQPAAALAAPGGAGLASAPEPERSLLGGVFRRLVDSVGFKTSRRRWWGIDLGSGEARAVCEGGEGLSSLPETVGGARAVERCRATGGVVRFDDADERLRLHPEAVSGLALPLAVRGRVHGVLVIESTRRRDFTDRDVERLAAGAEGFALALRLGQFRAWHVARFGSDLHVDPSLSGVRGFVEHLIAAGRSREPVVLSGDRGVGKRVLARWVHYERDGGAGPLRSVRCREPAAGEPGLGSRPADGSWLLEGLDELSPARQEELSAHIAGGGGSGAALVATSRLPLGVAAEAGRLRVGLADELARLEVLVPPLRRRREELPGLVRFLARRFAADERLGAPEFEESAIALLWRQEWEGNLRELEGLVFQLVLAAGGGILDAERVSAIARRWGHTLRSRVPSRHPSREDLVAALRSTRTRGGRTNKCRAAAFLGWDPDTLCARMAEAHLDEGELEEEPTAWDAPLS
jgi:hypothetical protein